MRVLLQDNLIQKQLQSALSLMSGLHEGECDATEQSGDPLTLAYEEMRTAGDRLLAALALEEQFRNDTAGGDEEALERWKIYRRTVEELSEGYAFSLLRWRSAILDKAAAEY
jgi:hypothetical protein